MGTSPCDIGGNLLEVRRHQRSARQGAPLRAHVGRLYSSLRDPALLPRPGISYNTSMSFRATSGSLSLGASTSLMTFVMLNSSPTPCHSGPLRAAHSSDPLIGALLAPRSGAKRSNP